MTDTSKHVEEKELAQPLQRELRYETLGFLMDVFTTIAYLLNRMGIPPCHLVAIVEEMEADGQLENCSKCGPIRDTDATSGSRDTPTQVVHHHHYYRHHRPIRSGQPKGDR